MWRQRFRLAVVAATASREPRADPPVLRGLLVYPRLSYAGYPTQLFFIADPVHLRLVAEQLDPHVVGEIHTVWNDLLADELLTALGTREP